MLVFLGQHAHTALAQDGNQYVYPLGTVNPYPCPRRKIIPIKKSIRADG